jgi:hypothetical protein
MKKTEAIVAFGLVVVILTAAFWDTIKNEILIGMTPAESISFLWNSFLHIVVVSVLAYFLYNAPEMIKPWLGAWKRGQRKAWKSGPNARWQKSVKEPRWTDEERALMLMAKLQQMQGRNSGSNRPRPNRNSENVRNNKVRW